MFRGGASFAGQVIEKRADGLPSLALKPASQRRLELSAPRVERGARASLRTLCIVRGANMGPG